MLYGTAEKLRGHAGRCDVSGFEKALRVFAPSYYGDCSSCHFPGLADHLHQHLNVCTRVRETGMHLTRTRQVCKARVLLAS